MLCMISSPQPFVERNMPDISHCLPYLAELPLRKMSEPERTPSWASAVTVTHYHSIRSDLGNQKGYKNEDGRVNWVYMEF